MSRNSTASDSRRLQKTLRDSRRKDAASPSSNVISAPQRLAVATEKHGKDGLVRRKAAMKDFLRSPTGSNRRQGKSEQADSAEDERAKGGADARTVRSKREKQIEDRVAELGRALSSAYEEQKKLLEELEDLRTDESTASLLAREAVDSPTRTDTPGREDEHTDNSESEDAAEREAWLREKVHMEEQVYILQDRLREMQGELVESDQTWQARWELYTSQAAAERNHYAEEAHRSQKDATERQRQLVELKQSISSLTRLENQVADEELSERMDNLYYKIRDWVVSSLRRSQLVDLSQLSGYAKCMLPGQVRSGIGVNKSQRLFLFQSVVVSSLMRIFEDSMYFGLPRTGVFASLRDCAGIAPNDSPEFARWRSLSLSIALKRGSDEIATSTDFHLSSLAQSTVALLRELSTPSMPEEYTTGLRAIFQQAVELSRDFNLQATPYRIHLPLGDPGDSSAGVLFDPSFMDIADGEDSEELEDRRVLYVLSPSVQKVNQNLRSGESQLLVISKAKVVISDDL